MGRETVGGAGQGANDGLLPACRERATQGTRQRIREGDKMQSGKPQGEQGGTEKETETREGNRGGSWQKQRMCNRDREKMTGEESEGGKTKPKPTKPSPRQEVQEGLGRRRRSRVPRGAHRPAAQGDGVGESHLLCGAPGPDAWVPL